MSFSLNSVLFTHIGHIITVYITSLALIYFSSCFCYFSWPIVYFSFPLFFILFLPFFSLSFTSESLRSLVYYCVIFQSALHFSPHHVTSLHFTSLHFTSLHFTSHPIFSATFSFSITKLTAISYCITNNKQSFAIDQSIFAVSKWN
jgi:hypothetical protein